MTQEKRLLLETKMNEILNDIITKYNLSDISYYKGGFGNYFFGYNINSEFNLKVSYDSCEISINSRFTEFVDQTRYEFKDLVDEEDGLFIIDIHLKHYFWKFLEDNYPKAKDGVS